MRGGACFEGAKLTACSFDGSNLVGASFRNANCKDSSFQHADLTGCDFRGANLEGTLWLDLRIDKTTDLRGARLINMFNQDYTDKLGRFTAGTDWRLATYDETTQFGNDPYPDQAEFLDAVLARLAEGDAPELQDLRPRFEALKVTLRQNFDSRWLENLLVELPAPRRDRLQRLLDEAMRDLL
jgi:uncharacterized protein YjbI with pentapeptide repeats